jgi:hypothetical protein
MIAMIPPESSPLGNFRGALQIIGISTQLAHPMSRYASREDYAKNGRLVGGTGKLFLPKGNGKHEGVYERIIIKKIGAA